MGQALGSGLFPDSRIEFSKFLSGAEHSLGYLICPAPYFKEGVRLKSNLAKAPIVSEIIQSISRFLLTPETRVRDLWYNDRPLKGAEHTALNQFLNRMKKAPSILEMQSS